MASTRDVERQLSNAGYLPGGVDFSPRPAVDPGIEGVVRGAAGKYGVDPDQALAVAKLESGLNPRAQNPRSSAGGLFQFIDSTWNQYGGGDKFDAATNADAGARYLRDVRDTLAKGLGRAPDVGELYLGHQQGAAGALRILKDPDGLARDAIGPDAVVLNGGTVSTTNRDFAAQWGRKAARAAGQTPGVIETLGAAVRQNNALAGLLGYGMPFHRGMDDPTFNPIVTADADPALRPHLSEFIDVRNRDEYDRAAARIRAANDDREVLGAAGMFGTVVSVAAGILDPINLIPIGGAAWRMLKVGRYVEGALGGVIAGGGGAALQELLLQQVDPTRTAEEGAMNIAGGTLGGAGLGVGGVLAGGAASRLGRAGLLAAGGAAGGAVAGAGEALYAGQDLGGALATIGTSAVIAGVLGGSIGALARPGRPARDALGDVARRVDIETAAGNGAIYADVRRQLLAAGRPEVEADAGGKLWQSHVDAIARATGTPQEDVYRSIGLDVRAGAVARAARSETPQSRTFADEAESRGLKPGTEEYNDAYTEWVARNASDKISAEKARRADEDAKARGVRASWRKAVEDWLGGAKDGDTITETDTGRTWMVTTDSGVDRHGVPFTRKTLTPHGEGGVAEDYAIRVVNGKIADGPLVESNLEQIGKGFGEGTHVASGAGAARGGETSEDALAQFRPPREVRWSRDVDATLAGKLGRDIQPTAGVTPNVLRAVGLPADQPVVIPQAVIRKTMTGKHTGEVPEAVIKGLPSLLRDPVMVVRSRTEPGNLVVVIDVAGREGAPIVAAINPTGLVKGKRAAVVASIHARDNAGRWLSDHITGGDVLYAHTAKAPALLRRLGVPDDIGRALSPAARLPVASPEGLRNDGAESPPTAADGVPSARDYGNARPRPQRTDAPTLGAGLPPQPEGGKRVITEADVINRLKFLQEDRPEGALGSTEFTPEGLARITLGARADASTFLHESGHVFLSTLDRLADQSPELAADLKTVREWLGNDGGAITRDQHEQFARGFEAYLRDGKAPNSALREVFKRFRDWLTGIYRSLTDLDVELSDDVREVMDRLIGIDEPARGSSADAAARDLSAASTPQASLDDLRVARGAGLLARVQSRIPIVGGPDLILGTSPVRASRWAMRKLMRPVLATVGDLAGRAEVATENVESAALQWHGGEVAAKQRADAAYAAYSKAAAAAGEPLIKARQFRDMASQAGRRGDSATKLGVGQEAQKAIAEVARAYREEVFDPLLKQALETGLLTQAQVDKARRFADSYIPRVWNVPMIIEQRTRFTNEIVMPQVVRDWEDARRKLAQVRQTTRFADEQLRQIEAAGIEHGGPDAAAFVAEGPERTPRQIVRENIKELQAAIDDPSVRWADGDEDRARMLIAKSRTPVTAHDGMEGIRKGGPALTAEEAQEVQDMLLRTQGLHPTDDADVGVRATRAVQAMRERVQALERAAKTARETQPLASMTKDQAAEASRLMAEQAEKLASDAEAVKALADQYEVALKKSLRERAKAYRTLDADDNLGRLDEEELPGVASDIVDALVGHTNNRLQYEALKVQARGALKEKTFNVHDTLVDGSRGGDSWIENDIMQLAATYTRTLAPDVELKRLTGDVNAEPLRQQIVQEYTDRANAMEDGKAKTRLDKRMKRDLEAFDGVVARLRGQFGLPTTSAGVAFLRSARLFKALNLMRLMGWSAVSQLSDVPRVIFRSGVSRFLGDAVAPIVSNWQAVKLTKRELQLADIATDLVRSSMALRGAELFDDYARTSMVERAAQKAAAGAVRLFGLDHWNQGVKTISGLIAQHTIVDGVNKLASGAEMKPMEIADLSRVGIGVREAEFLKPFLDEFGQDVHGITIPNTADWAGERAADAVRLWRGALRQVVDDMVINPGQDRALGLSTTMGSVLWQIETFNLVSTQRTILAGIQRWDAGVLIGSSMMIGLGMLSYYLKAQLAGWALPDDPGEWVLQGVNASGLLGVIGSVDRRLLATTRGAVGSEALIGSPTRSRYAAAPFSSLFGPSAGLGETVFGGLQDASAGDWNWRNTHQLRSLVPMQNWWLTRRAFDAGERGFNDMFGIKQRPPMRQ